MDFCNLCKKNNFTLLDKYNIYNQDININYYFNINNKYYQCICYKNCSQFELYKDKQKWLNYIGMLYVSNSIINILYNNNLYRCILVEYIPKDNYFILNHQYNNLDEECIIITNDNIIKLFNKKYNSIGVQSNLCDKILINNFTNDFNSNDYNTDIEIIKNNNIIEKLQKKSIENSEKIKNLENTINELKNNYNNDFEFDFLTV